VTRELWVGNKDLTSAVSPAFVFANLLGDVGELSAKCVLRETFGRDLDVV
jgi:hypothetical protein